MEEQNSTFTSVLREDTFEVVVRGYNKRQVHEYMSRTRRQVKDLEEKLRRANESVDDVRLELENTKKTAVARPAHEEVSDRLSQILKLADEEADQRRAAASEDIARMRELAEQDAQRVVDEARRQAERIVTDAKEESDRDLAGAREEAQRLLQTSSQQADHTLTDAQSRAKSLLDQTERRAGAINEVLSTRLMALTSTHAEAVRRLSEMRDTMAGLLADDAAGGPLAAAVEAAMAQPLGSTEMPPLPAAAEMSDEAPVQTAADIADAEDETAEVIDLVALDDTVVVPVVDEVPGPPARR